MVDFKARQKILTTLWSSDMISGGSVNSLDILGKIISPTGVLTARALQDISESSEVHLGAQAL